MSQNKTESNNWYDKTWLVLVLCFIFFPLGLFALWKNSSIPKFWKILITSIIALILIAAFSDTKEISTKSNKENVEIDKKELNTVFNIPTYLNKNIDEIRTILGKPIDAEQTEPTKQQMEMDFEEWDNTFEKENCSLTITFNPQTRKIIDFFITTTTPNKIENIDELLKLGNLENDSSDYELKTVFESKTENINGITITPN